MTEEEKCYSVKEYVLWKLDRTIAVLGLVALGVWALYRNTPETVQIGIAVVGVLGGYIGGRAGNK